MTLRRHVDLIAAGAVFGAHAVDTLDCSALALSCTSYSRPIAEGKSRRDAPEFRLANECPTDAR